MSNESSQGKILIPGGDGMIGRATDTGLTQKGFKVEISTIEKDRASVRDGIHYIDFRHPETGEEVIIKGGFDAIICLAGISDPRVAKDNPELADQVNHLGVIQMLESIKKLPREKRPIVILPCSILQFDIRESGLISVHHPLKENGDSYVLSKNNMFYDALKYLPDIDIRFAFIGNTTGEGQSLGFFGPDIMDQFVRGETIISHGDLKQKRPFLHSKDAASILYYAITSPKSGIGNRFLVTSGFSPSLEDFFRSMAKIAGRYDEPGEPDPKFGGPARIKELRFDIQMLEKLGFRQQNGLDQISLTLLKDRFRVLNGGKLPERGIFGY